MADTESQTRALIVDDEPAIARMLRERLSFEGFDCETASNGEEALQLMQQEAFDIVVSDLHMPGMSGLELLSEVRNKFPHIAFLMATGEGDVRVGIEAMKRGADDYLVKPLHLDMAVASIKRGLEKKRLEMELEEYRAHLEEMVDKRTKQIQAAIQRIELTYDETLETLGAALDLRDNNTAGHSRRVTLFCLQMAVAMGCSGLELQHLSRGAYLHDIGKIGIPDSILLKAAKLTAEETAIMQTHARIGYDLVSRIAFLAPAAEIVLTHQERWDGTGYPQGLMEKEIPLGARIFAVADTLDAMTSDRPYRRALPFSAARAEIEGGSGRQFDPEVAKVFLATPQQVWENIRLEVGAVRAHPLTPKPGGLPLPARENPN